MGPGLVAWVWVGFGFCFGYPVVGDLMLFLQGFGLDFVMLFVLELDGWLISMFRRWREVLGM